MLLHTFTYFNNTVAVTSDISNKIFLNGVEAFGGNPYVKTQVHI